MISLRWPTRTRSGALLLPREVQVRARPPGRAASARAPTPGSMPPARRMRRVTASPTTSPPSRTREVPAARAPALALWRALSRPPRRRGRIARSWQRWAGAGAAKRPAQALQLPQLVPCPMPLPMHRLARVPLPASCRSFTRLRRLPSQTCPWPSSRSRSPRRPTSIPAATRATGPAGTSTAAEVGVADTARAAAEAVARPAPSAPAPLHASLNAAFSRNTQHTPPLVSRTSAFSHVSGSV